MRGNRKNGKNGVPLSLQFIADREQRIAKQKQLIAELKGKGRSTAHAEAELRRELLALATLRNHSDLSMELAKGDPYKRPLGEQTAQPTLVARNRDG